MRYIVQPRRSTDPFKRFRVIDTVTKQWVIGCATRGDAQLQCDHLNTRVPFGARKG